MLEVEDEVKKENQRLIGEEESTTQRHNGGEGT